jgi:hypothetical protein
VKKKGNTGFPFLVQFGVTDPADHATFCPDEVITCCLDPCQEKFEV